MNEGRRNDENKLFTRYYGYAAMSRQSLGIYRTEQDTGYIQGTK